MKILLTILVGFGVLAALLGGIALAGYAWYLVEQPGTALQTKWAIALCCFGPALLGVAYVIGASVLDGSGRLHIAPASFTLLAVPAALLFTAGALIFGGKAWQ